MAKRGRSTSLDKLVAQISSLDAQRKALVGKLRHAVSAWSGESPFPWSAAVAGKRGPGRPKGSTGPRKRRKMSAAARKAISDAQKKRWAAQKAGEKKK